MAELHVEMQPKAEGRVIPAAEMALRDKQKQAQESEKSDG